MIMLALLAVAASVPQPSEIKTFKDWTVGCDNGRSCQGVALMPEEWTEEAVTMSVRRSPAKAVQIAFGMTEGSNAALLKADGRPLPVRLSDSEEGPRVVPADTPALLQAIRSAHRLDIFGSDGKSLGFVSLEGATAAFLYMDEQQKGGPVPLPIIRAAPAFQGPPPKIGKSRIAALRKQSGCTIDEVGGPDSFDVSALGPNHSLILLACGSGAYNVSNVAYIAVKRPRGLEIGFAPFDARPGWGESENPILVNAAWEEERGLLTAFSKGRGLGDCGTISEYAWDGSSFRLAMKSEMHECRGSIDYITTWRAEVQR